VLAAPYGEVVREPAAWSCRISDFLGGLDEAAMAAAVDPALYRHRSSPHKAKDLNGRARMG
jgi:hypothetical protein